MVLSLISLHFLSTEILDKMKNMSVQSLVTSLMNLSTVSPTLKAACFDESIFSTYLHIN